MIALVLVSEVTLDGMGIIALSDIKKTARRASLCIYCIFL